MTWSIVLMFKIKRNDEIDERFERGWKAKYKGDVLYNVENLRVGKIEMIMVCDENANPL